MVDALSDVLRVVGLSGAVFVEAEFTDPWYVAGQIDPEYCRPYMTPPQHVVCYHYVVEGRFDVRVADSAPVRVEAGEAILLPHNDLHFFGSAETCDPVNTAELILPESDTGLMRIAHGGGGAKTRLVCGFLGGNAQIQPLLAGLPRMLKIEIASMPAGAWVAQSFAYAARTRIGEDPGAATVLAKISELLFVEAVRAHLATLPAEETGWLAGLRDPAVGRALALLHARMAENWTADALAEAVNLSRSAFAERFTTLIGAPPMRYLTQWRMRVACQKLKETRATVAQIAYDVGYDSEAAFARAFRREIGSPPGVWRKTAAPESAAQPAA